MDVRQKGMPVDFVNPPVGVDVTWCRRPGDFPSPTFPVVWAVTHSRRSTNGGTSLALQLAHCAVWILRTGPHRPATRGLQASALVLGEKRQTSMLAAVPAERGRAFLYGLMHCGYLPHQRRRPADGDHRFRHDLICRFALSQAPLTDPVRRLRGTAVLRRDISINPRTQGKEGDRATWRPTRGNTMPEFRSRARI